MSSFPSLRKWATIHFLEAINEIIKITKNNSHKPCSKCLLFQRWRYILLLFRRLLKYTRSHNDRKLHCFQVKYRNQLVESIGKIHMDSPKNTYRDKGILKISLQTSRLVLRNQKTKITKLKFETFQSLENPKSKKSRNNGKSQNLRCYNIL